MFARLAEHRLVVGDLVLDAAVCLAAEEFDVEERVLALDQFSVAVGHTPVAGEVVEMRKMHADGLAVVGEPAVSAVGEEKPVAEFDVLVAPRDEGLVKTAQRSEQLAVH
jgi:hypothetical protein